MKQKPPSRRRAAERDADILARAQSGEKQNDIAAYYGLSRSHVQTILSKSGFKKRSGMKVTSNPGPGGAKMSRPTVVFGEHQDNTLAQMADVAERAERTALMADGHLGYTMPIGGVAGYRDQVSVSGVGFDIACGNAAIKTDLTFDQVVDFLPDYADEIARTLSFGMGGTNKQRDAPRDHPLFQDDAWDLVPLWNRGNLLGKARAQLGTIGSGNHYVDVFADNEDGAIWVGVHFGSRGFGYTVARNFLAISKGLKWGAKPGKEQETLLDLGQPSGDDYWSLMTLAGEYASAGREWAARKTVEILGGEELDLVHNHHNFAWKEDHLDGFFVVVRKGATPAWPGQRGFVGGSMGDDSVILKGTGVIDDLSDQQIGALCSTVHGAGRVMSRTEARGKMKWKTREIIRPGKVTQEMMDEWVEGKGVELRGGGLDESPHVYRRLDDVLKAQGDTIDVLHRLRPLIVVMAGAGR